MKKILFLLIGLCFIPGLVLADEYGNVYSRITNDGNLTVPSIETDDYLQMELFTVNYAKSLVRDASYFITADTCNYSMTLNDCAGPEQNEDGSYNIPVTLQWPNGEKDNYNNPLYDQEEHTLKVKFIGNLDESIVDLSSDIGNELEGNLYVVDDLGFINYIYSIPNGKDIIDYIDYGLLYSNEVIETIGNSNITYLVDNRMGDTEAWNTMAAGPMTFAYNGIFVNMVDPVQVRFKPIVYIPDDTEDTTDAYIEAVMERINEYFGSDVGFEISATDTTITSALAGTGETPLTHFDENVLNDDYNGMNNKLDVIYEVNVNGNTYYILIEKDSSKMVTPIFGAKDDKTDISVNASNGSISLDTIIQANYLTEDDEEYDIVAGRINGDFVAIDISLYSQLKGSKITKLDNGEFEVSIPIPDSLNGKTLSIYYIANDGTVETHEVTPVGGYAKFTTTHFSVYTLAEQNAITSVPQTIDNIYLYISLTVISILGLITIKKYLFNK